MKINVQNSSGKVVESIKMDNSIFNIEINSSVVRQAVLSELSNLRQGTHSSKNRSDVRGGGKKPWKQKGRGVARAGTIRSPLWRGGGVVFGPEPHRYSKKLPKKMSKLARKSVLTKKLQDGELIVLDSINVSSKKTSDFVTFMQNIDIINKKTLILVGSFQENLILSSRNLRNVFIENIKSVSVYDLLDSEVILIDKEGVNIFSEVLI
tara:strand:- start:30 stop:653 length:624 start_codon:yes stop_codon:yes gene_type:complete